MEQLPQPAGVCRTCGSVEAELSDQLASVCQPSADTELSWGAGHLCVQFGQKLPHFCFGWEVLRQELDPRLHVLEILGIKCRHILAMAAHRCDPCLQGVRQHAASVCEVHTWLGLVLLLWPPTNGTIFQDVRSWALSRLRCSLALQRAADFLSRESIPLRHCLQQCLQRAFAADTIRHKSFRW